MVNFAAIERLKNLGLILAIGAACSLATFYVWQKIPSLGALEVAEISDAARAQTSEPSRSVSLITVGDRTRSQLDPSGVRRFVSRKFQAQMLKLLRDAGAKVVVFDLAFRAVTPEDVDLVKALESPSKTPTVIAALETPKSDVVSKPSIWPKVPAKNVWLGSTRSFIPGGKLVKFHAARRDGASGDWIPHLSVAAVAASMNATACQVDVKGNHVTIGALELDTMDGLDILPVPSAYSKDIATAEFIDVLKLSPKVGSKRYANQIVIVGEDSQADTHSSAVGPVLGSLWVARMTAALQEPNTELLSEITDWTLLIGLGTLASLAAAIVISKPSLAWWIFSACLVVAWLAPPMLLTSFGVPIPRYLPIVVVMLSSAVALLARLIREAKFLPWFAKQATAAPISRMGTYVFIDIKNSSALARELTADETRDVFTRVLQAVAQVVERHGGMVERLLGDGLLCAFFGEDKDRTQSALASMGEAHGLHLEFLGHFIELTMGAEDGPTAGQVIRTATLTDWSNFGETIHLAARLQGACSTLGVPILIGPGMATKVPDDVARIATHDLKGFGETEIFAPSWAQKVNT